MRDRIFFSTGIACALFFCVIFAGCGSTPPARFYTLNSLKQAQPAQQSQTESTTAYIRLGPVDIPDYMDRPQIVTRTGENELKISEFDRWGGSFKNDVSRVLMENISVVLAGTRTTVMHWKQYAPGAYRVPVTISRLDIYPGANLSLKAQWSIIDKDGRTVTAVRESNISRKVNGTSYETIVVAINESLADLSREIASSVTSVLAKGK